MITSSFASHFRRLAIAGLSYLALASSLVTADSNIYWAPWQGHLPSNAVIAGQAAGSSLGICLVDYQNGQHPGKVYANKCNFGWGGQEIVVSHNFEVLVAESFVTPQWAASSHGRLPRNAWEAAQYAGVQGYVCRAHYRNGVHAGKVYAGKCNIGWGGSEIVLDNYEVLLAPTETAEYSFSAELDFSGQYRLQTQFRGHSECLEGNQSASPVHGGAAFMDRCQNVSGQIWNIEPAGNGYYRLKTQFRGARECLEGNQAASQVHGGAAFMDRCQNVSGQLWQIEPVDGGFVRLKTQFRGANECLEGNQSASPVHNGAAFMDRCQNVSGQLWRLAPVNGG